MAEPRLTAHVRHSLGDFILDAELDLPATGISVIFGPSGCGKTSLLRCLAGLEQPKGQITFGDHVWLSPSVNLPAHQRPIAYVFQEASLFPHLNVADNLAFAERHALKRSASSEKDTLLDLFDIGHTLKRTPESLSGGERQRVAIVRALMRQPALLLMDEPLASLDEGRKQDILPYIERLRDELSTPVIYVTHSLAETARLADYLVALEQGCTTISGPLHEILTDQAFPADIGSEAGSIIEGGISSIDSHWQLAHVHIDTGVSLRLPAQGLRPGQAVKLWIQARDISLSHHPESHSSILNTLPCTITDIRQDANPAMCIVYLRCGKHTLLTRITRASGNHLQLRPGLSLYAQIKAAALI